MTPNRVNHQKATNQALVNKLLVSYSDLDFEWKYIDISDEETNCFYEDTLRNIRELLASMGCRLTWDNLESFSAPFDESLAREKGLPRCLWPIP